MATVTKGGNTYTTDSRGIVTSGPRGSVGISINSIAGSTSTPAATTTSAARPTTTATAASTPAATTSPTNSNNYTAHEAASAMRQITVPTATSSYGLDIASTPTVADVPTGVTGGLPSNLDQVDTTEYVKQLAEAQRQSRLSAMDSARTKALSDLDTYKTNNLASLETTRGNNLTSFKNSLASSNAAYDTERGTIAPAYYNKRNQAAAASEVGAMNFANYMAARGIRGAAGAMPEIYRNASLQGQIGALDQAEAQDQADLAARRTATQTAYDNNVANLETAYNTDLNALNTDYDTRKLGIQSAYDSDVTQANADVDANSLQAYIDQQKNAQAAALQMEQLKRQNLEYQQKVTDAQKKSYEDTIGQYYNDYQAEINNVTNDGDSSNDWQIAFLQAARNKKLKEQEEATAKAKQQEEENQQAWARINKSGSSGTKTSTSINQQNTQEVIAELLQHNATGQANLFNQYASYWASQGVDIAKVKATLGL